MNLNEEVELLKLVPIFSKIEQAKLKLLAFTSERVNFAVGQEVCHQGDPGDTMYVILGGTADVVRSKSRHDRQISHLDGVG
jgi:CRP-like cAMP-binding protein